MAAEVIEQALRAVLVADVGVSAITTRVYPNYIPQAPTWPLVVYQKVSGERDHDITGPTGKAHPRFQLECWAETYDEAKSLANAVREALDGNTFTEGAVTIGSVVIQTEFDAYEPDVKCHRIVMDFNVWHTE
jgi:hypothetical protein